MEKPWSLRAWTFKFSASSVVCWSTFCSSGISSMDTCWKGVSLSFSKSKLVNASQKRVLPSSSRTRAFCWCPQWRWQCRASSSLWAEIRLQGKAAQGLEDAHHFLPPIMAAALVGLGGKPNGEWHFSTSFQPTGHPFLYFQMWLICINYLI